MSEGKKVEKPCVNVRYVYMFCNDILTIRHFYTDLLGMNEVAYDDKSGWLNYKCDGFYMMFFKTEKDKIPVEERWAYLPGPGERPGDIDVISITVLIPEEDYKETVKRLLTAGVPLRSKVPEWMQYNYWGFIVKDPMGMTVEVTTVPKENPESTVWVDK
jgi:catechol 2,3-dioxygenase-like lactoylglutathione lyase family enzyme